MSRHTDRVGWTDFQAHKRGANFELSLPESVWLCKCVSRFWKTSQNLVEQNLCRVISWFTFAIGVNVCLAFTASRIKRAEWDEGPPTVSYGSACTIDRLAKINRKMWLVEPSNTKRDSVVKSKSQSRLKHRSMTFVLSRCTLFAKVLSSSLGLEVLAGEGESHWVDDDCEEIKVPECPAGFVRPPLIIFSVDGFRASYMKKGSKVMPNIEKLRKSFLHCMFSSVFQDSHCSAVGF
ncbi:hypothetical protein STEG23_032311 [Scotinomys teguina]